MPNECFNCSRKNTKSVVCSDITCIEAFKVIASFINQLKGKRPGDPIENDKKKQRLEKDHDYYSTEYRSMEAGDYLFLLQRKWNEAAVIDLDNPNYFKYAQILLINDRLVIDLLSKFKEMKLEDLKRSQEIYEDEIDENLSFNRYSPEIFFQSMKKNLKRKAGLEKEKKDKINELENQLKIGDKNSININILKNELEEINKKIIVSIHECFSIIYHFIYFNNDGVNISTIECFESLQQLYILLSSIDKNMLIDTSYDCKFILYDKSELLEFYGKKKCAMTYYPNLDIALTILLSHQIIPIPELVSKIPLKLDPQSVFLTRKYHLPVVKQITYYGSDIYAVSSELITIASFSSRTIKKKLKNIGKHYTFFHSIIGYNIIKSVKGNTRRYASYLGVNKEMFKYFLLPDTFPLLINLVRYIDESFQGEYTRKFKNILVNYGVIESFYNSIRDDKVIFNVNLQNYEGFKAIFLKTYEICLMSDAKTLDRLKLYALTKTLLYNIMTGKTEEFLVEYNFYSQQDTLPEKEIFVSKVLEERTEKEILQNHLDYHKKYKNPFISTDDMFLLEHNGSMIECDEYTFFKIFLYHIEFPLP